jgi:hypothetical protein
MSCHWDPRLQNLDDGFTMLRRMATVRGAERMGAGLSGQGVKIDLSELEADADWAKRDDRPARAVGF